MPVPKGVRYRVVKRGKNKIRLAFKGKKVVEAKNLKTGATHTPAEFRADARRRKRGKKSKARKR
jgi:hypothetical protein